jgi:hypothetical protein
MRGIEPAPGPLADAYARVTAALPAGLLDRPLDEDLAAAQQLLPGLAEIPGAR